jgi:hypothetical protein
MTLFLVYFFAFPLALAHSWVEQLQRVNSTGYYDGPYGYPRSFIPRSTQGFQDALMTYRLPPSDGDRERINATDRVCALTQTTGFAQDPAFPRLTIAPGEFVALKYLENGHVTLPNIPLGKPPGSGTVAVYALSGNDDNLALLDVLSWDPTAPLTKGRLLTAQNFDDNRCYQINTASNISIARQLQFPDYIPGQFKSIHEQWCAAIAQIPPDTPSGTLALIWVWAWPTLPNVDPNLISGKDEYYTTCMDIEISDSDDLPQTSQQPLPYQDPQVMAVADFRQRASTLNPRLLQTGA